MIINILNIVIIFLHTPQYLLFFGVLRDIFLYSQPRQLFDQMQNQKELFNV